jgi:hypothetical protein
MTGPKDDQRTDTGPDRDNLASQYEQLRAAVLADGPAPAGLGAALLMAKGVAGWMRGWRACTPSARPSPPERPVGTRPPSEVVSVLAAMALACADGR